MSYADSPRPGVGPAIEAVDLRKSFGETTVLDGVDLSAPRGTVLALLGPNGAGKTTTVRILSTLMRPDAGHGRICGHDVVHESGAVRRLISLTGQEVAVDEQQTGRENLQMVGRLHHLGRAGTARRADELLEQFELADAGHRRVATFSGGMRRRLDLALGLVVTPSVAFLDEPTTGLDPISRTALWSVVQHLVEEGTTVLLTTQHLEEADRLAHQIVLIDGGRVAAAGTAAELKRRVGGARVDLRFHRAPEAEAAQRVLVSVGAGMAAADPLTVSLPSDGSAAHVRHVLNTLANLDLEVDVVSQHEPTLDDVFAAVVGARP